MRLPTLQLLPRVRESWTFLYVEYVRVEQDDHAIMLSDVRGRTPVPVSALSVLMLGPGTTITHAAILALADNGCSVVWCGERGVRFYASGLGETRRAVNLMAQAEAWADPGRRIEVVRRLYTMRFSETLDPQLTLQQIRGREGVRVREAYARWSRETGVPWNGRAYRQGEWTAADRVNRALSAANACLYGVCHGAIAAAGFTPGLGFIHTGKLLAFVYDVADLYKCEVTVPAAFAAAAEPDTPGLETRVRLRCRETFRRARVLERIVGDIQRALGQTPETTTVLERGEDDAAIAALWDPSGNLAGGQNHAATDEIDEEESWD